MTAAVFEERPDPGAAASLALAFAVHVLLVAVLVFGVRWQNPPPRAVSVELWEPPAVPEPPKPVPKAEPAPPPRPEPRIEKPQIVEQKAPPPRPRPVARPAPPRPAPPRDAEAQKRLREELAREQAALAIERERSQIRDLLERDAQAADLRARAAWTDRIRAKIRGNIVLPPDIKGNPEAVFDVVQLPTGEVLSARLRKSSGHRGYDAAVERAILKSSPLPRPDRPELFVRELELKFRPLDPV